MIFVFSFFSFWFLEILNISIVLQHLSSLCNKFSQREDSEHAPKLLAPKILLSTSSTCLKTYKSPIHPSHVASLRPRLLSIQFSRPREPFPILDHAQSFLWIHRALAPASPPRQSTKIAIEKRSYRLTIAPPVIYILALDLLQLCLTYGS